MAGICNYRDLEIWKRGMDLTQNVYRITHDFPKIELYGLTSQMRRSALSIPSNIAEGFIRKQEKDLKRFLNISLASLAELETQILLSLRLEYLNQDIAKNLLDQTQVIGKMTIKFIQNMR